MTVSLSQTEAAQFDVSWKVPAILYYAKRNYHTKYDLRSTISQTLTQPSIPGCMLFLLMLACASQLKTP